MSSYSCGICHCVADTYHIIKPYMKPNISYSSCNFHDLTIKSSWLSKEESRDVSHDMNVLSWMHVSIIRAVSCYIDISLTLTNVALKWRHNEGDGVSNHQPHDCLLNPYSRRRSKKTSKLHGTGLCEGNYVQVKSLSYVLYYSYYTCTLMY